MDALRQSHSSPLSSRSPSTLTNDDIEAVIQMATASRSSSDGRPLKDTRTQLFVGNLPYRVRWQDLKDLFRRAGTVLRADVSLGPDNRSRGYGTVLLATAEDAGRAIDLFNGYSWQTRVLEVRPDRLPPDYDANHPPAIVSASGLTPTSLHVSKSSDELDYSTILDLHHSFPGAMNNSLRSLFVGNLPFHCQWQDLKDLFRQAGTILRADVALGQDGRSRGFGTVTFATEVDADRAVTMFNGYEYNGRTLKVNHDKFTQLMQPNAVSAMSTPASSASPVPPSPAPSIRSASDPRMALPSAAQARQLSSLGQPGNLPIGYHLGLGGSSSHSPAPYDRWGLQQQQELTTQKARDERERELLRTFPNLDIGSSRASSTISNNSMQAPSASRSTSNTSNSSSTKPPSIVTTASSGSVFSSSSSKAGSASTSNTSEKSSTNHPLPPSLARHRRLSSSNQRQSSNVLSPASSSSPKLRTVSPATAESTPQLPTRHPPHRSPSSHHSHAHRPGPISLPPPPHVTSFPLTHHGHPNLSPHGAMGFSPLHHPLGSPSSPPFPHHAHMMSHHQQQVQQIQHQHQHQQHMMTPHGLPEFTPSMPPFNFLPPASSPAAGNTSTANTGASANNPPQHQHHPAYSPYAHPLPSPVQMGMPVHLTMLMHGQPSSPILPHPIHPLHQHQQHPHQAPFGITPLTPPNTASFAAANGDSTGAAVPYTPLGTFSPGIAMSPGAFWGRPGAPNAMINPAVGAPVHLVHVTPGHNPGHGHGGNMSPGYYAAAQEPTGYFDAGYFPPMFGAGVGAVGGSRLVNEIMKDKGEKEEVRSGERRSDAGGDEREEQDAEREGREVSEEVVDDRPLGDGSTLGPGEERVRRHSSTGATPWQSNPGTGEGDSRVWEGRERERGETKDAGVTVDLNEELALVGEGGGIAISRTHSMSSSKKPLEMLSHRPESDPAGREGLMPESSVRQASFEGAPSVS